MCLNVDVKATKEAKKEQGVVKRYKILLLATNDSYSADLFFLGADNLNLPGRSFLVKALYSVFFHHLWKIGINKPYFWQSQSFENKIFGGVIHVYVNKPDNIIKQYPYPPAYAIVEVECNRKHLVAVGVDGEDCKTEAYSEVTLTQEEYNRVMGV